MPFSKKFRLPLRQERQRLDSVGVPLHTPLFTLVKAPSPDKVTSSRFAVLVSKKVSPLAVDRNHLKRLVSSAITDFIVDIPLADYLIIPKKIALNSTYSQIVSDLKQAFRK